MCILSGMRTLLVLASILAACAAPSPGVDAGPPDSRSAHPLVGTWHRVQSMPSAALESEVSDWQFNADGSLVLSSVATYLATSSSSPSCVSTDRLTGRTWLATADTVTTSGAWIDVNATTQCSRAADNSESTNTEAAGMNVYRWEITGDMLSLTPDGGVASVYTRSQ